MSPTSPLDHQLRSLACRPSNNYYCVLFSHLPSRAARPIGSIFVFCRGSLGCLALTAFVSSPSLSLTCAAAAGLYKSRPLYFLCRFCRHLRESQTAPVVLSSLVNCPIDPPTAASGDRQLVPGSRFASQWCASEISGLPTKFKIRASTIAKAQRPPPGPHTTTVEERVTARALGWIQLALIGTSREMYMAAIV